MDKPIVVNGRDIGAELEAYRRDSRETHAILDQAGVGERGARLSIRVAVLVKDRDALLAACKRAYDALNELLGAEYDVAGDMAVLRAAITKARGE